MKKGILFASIALAFGLAISVAPATLRGNETLNAASEPTIAAALENDHNYKIGMVRTLDGVTSTYYFTGAMDGHDLATVKDDINAAVDVKATLKEGNTKVNLSFTVDGVTKYLKFEHVDKGKSHFDNAVFSDTAFDFDYSVVDGKARASAILQAGTQYEKTCVLGADARPDSKKTTMSPRNLKYASTTAIADFYIAPELTADEKAANAYGDKLITLTAADCEAKDVKAETWTAAKTAFNELSAGAKAIFTAASANENGTATEKGAARYDAVLAAHTELENFANRTVKASANGISANNDNTIIIVSVSVLAVAILGASVLLLKHRRAEN